MTKAQKTEMEEARADLRNRLKPGQEILCVLRSVSRSGMQRVIDLKVVEDGEMRGLGWTAATAMGETFDAKREGIKATGCGMDMGFQMVYSLSRVLWPDGFDCVGEGTLDAPHAPRRCPCNDHSNREHNAHHRDGGYALRSRWI